MQTKQIRQVKGIWSAGTGLFLFIAAEAAITYSPIMVAPVPVESGPQSELRRLPLPDPLPDGCEPEARVVVCGISWKNYIEFDKQLGNDRPSPRFYYLQGELEVMTTSREHERIKEWIGGMVDYYTDSADILTFLYGQATLRLPFKQTGAEPDKSWCFGEDKEVPDPVLEIALTTGGEK